MTEGATIGLYHANPYEAPTAAYARHFFEQGHELALPAASPVAAKHTRFARFIDPFDDSDLEKGPYGQPQPLADAPLVQPQVLFVPLVGFTSQGAASGRAADITIAGWPITPIQWRSDWHGIASWSTHCRLNRTISC